MDSHTGVLHYGGRGRSNRAMVLHLTQAFYGPVSFTLKNYPQAGFANNFAASISIDFLIGCSAVIV